MSGNGRLSIREIAAEGGVSVATVSRVLNGTGNVIAGLRQRVVVAADQLGYRPNGVARSLRLRRTTTLGAVIPTITNPYFTDSVRAMQDAAAGYGYTLLVANSDRDPAKEETALTTLLDRRVDGVVLVSAALAPAPSPALRAFLESGTPLVAMDRALPSLDLDRVVVDTRGGAREAVAHLVQRGRRRIACIAGPPSISTATEKLAGYRDGLADAGLPFEPALVLPGDYTLESGEAQARALLTLQPRPDAVLIANNLMMLGAFRVLLRRDVAIPDQVALVGYDDVAWTDAVRPALSVVAQPSYELGRRAVELLVARLSGRRTEPQSIIEILPTNLIVRESS
ncbi:MAG: LacI family DNA-binding transcriptional regulator [Chloroflexota bacterium]